MYIPGKCQHIALIEMMLLGSGGLLPVDRGTNIPLWQQQQEFKSPVFYRKYKATLDKRIRFFCRWFDITFRYNMGQNQAKIILKQDGYDRLMALLDRGFNLLEQSDPASLVRMRKLLPLPMKPMEGDDDT